MFWYKLFVLFISVTSLLRASLSPPERHKRTITGDNCQYISLAAVTDVTGCRSGEQFVVEEEEFVTGHLVVVTGELLLVFIRVGRKLSQCDRYTDITSNVTCQVINSL